MWPYSESPEEWKRVRTTILVPAFIAAGIVIGVMVMILLSLESGERGENSSYVYSAEYQGKVWRVEAENVLSLPRNYRDSFNTNKLGDANRSGLIELQASASGQFSESQFKVLASNLIAVSSGKIYMIDLREESHGFVNGKAVSWYGKHNWGNLGLSKSDIVKDEQERFGKLVGTDIEVFQLDKDKGVNDKKVVSVSSTLLEQQLVQPYGFTYVRIPVTDHKFPKSEQVDEFVSLVKSFPPGSWVHMHCQAGKGRTTTFMVMYDIMKNSSNPDVNLQDIVYRQYRLGGHDVLNTKPASDKDAWKGPLFKEKATMITLFYEYVEENSSSNYEVPWSKWLLDKGVI